MRHPALLSLLVMCMCACAKGLQPGDSSGGGGDAGGSAQSVGSGGAASSGAGGSGAAGSGTGTAGSGGGCTPQNPVTSAVHITVAVSWAGNAEYAAGNDTMHLWTKVTQMYTGNDFTGTARLCGILFPDLTATPAAGGKLIGLNILDAAWDSTNMPSDPIGGTQTGAGVGSMVTVNQSALLLGHTMPNPVADPWPVSYTTITQVDHDTDGHPGFSAGAKVGPTYQMPWVNALMTIRADRLYLATRFVMVLSGMVDTCSTVSGAAIVEKLETHVLGCHLLGSNDCAALNTQYVDDNRTIFTPGNGTFVSQTVPDSATCADVRAAVP